MKRRMLILILILAAVGGGAYYASTQHTHEIVITGMVTTDDVIVSAMIQGRLQELRVREGDKVKRGDLLALIAPEQWQADMAYSTHNEAHAATQVTQAQADLQFQQEQTTNQIHQAQATLASTESQVTQAQSDLENAQLTFNREEGLYKQGIESVQTYDQARTTLDGQKARVESLRQQVQAARAALEMAKSNEHQNTSRRAALEADEHLRQAAAAQKDKAQVQLGYTEIRSPIDGVVDVRAARQGEVVNPAQAIVTLINPDDLWVRADVEESYIDRIRLGDHLVVRLPSGFQQEGVVFYRAVDADYATQRDVSRTKRDIKTFEIRLRCDNADRHLAAGMTAFVTMPVGEH